MKRDEQILKTVTELLAEVIGDDMPDLDVTMETSFSEHLELESIEFVALAEKLRRHFGEEVDFTAWLADKELDDILSLSVGDLVRFIASCTSTSTD